MPVGPGYDPSVWTRCEDAEGQQALQAGETALEQDDFQGVVENLRVVVARCPRLVRGHELYQDAALRLGGEAEAEMRATYAALAADTARPELAWAKARLLPSNADRLAAVEAIIERNRSFPYAHLSQARLLRDFEKFEPAVDAFERALSLDASLADARLELADLLILLGNDREARPYLEDYVRARPFDLPARRDLIRLLLYELEDPRAAEPHVAFMLGRDDGDPDTLLDQAAVHWRLDRYGEAREIYRRVLQAHPQEGRAALNLANLYFEPLARDEAGKREFWPLARKAYRYFLSLGRASDGYDAFDLAFAVPLRLREIEALLGPAPDTVPTVDDL